jgi:hypothetical protein
MADSLEGLGRFGSTVSRPVDQVAGGWQASGIVTVRSVLPFTAFSGTDNANTGGSNEYIQIVSQPVPAGFNQSRAVWFAPAAFAISAFGTLGNSSRNAFRGLISQDVNLGLMKNSGLTEKLKLQSRSRFFNLLTKKNLGNLNPTVTSGQSFGEILSAYAARGIQFAHNVMW